MQKIDALLKRRRDLGNAIVNARHVITGIDMQRRECLLVVEGYNSFISVPREPFKALAETTLASLEEECKKLDATIEAIETLI